MPSSDKKKQNLIDEVQIRDMSHVKEHVTYVPKGGSATKIGGQNIVTVEISKEQTIQQFEPGKIRDTKGVKYSDVVRGIPTSVLSQSNRFRLNELTLGPLSVEAEEEQRIENEIQRRLTVRIEEIRGQIMADAYREGFTGGKEDGRQEVLTESRPKIQQLEKLTQEFDGMREEIFKANEEFLLHIVQQLTKSVVLRELNGDADYVRRLAVHLLERLGTRENVKIFVSEAELSSADKLKEGLAQSLGQLKNISIEPDPALKDGGCRVETEFGEVDGRIEIQLQNIATGLGVSQSKP